MIRGKMSPNSSRGTGKLKSTFSGSPPGGFSLDFSDGDDLMEPKSVRLPTKKKIPGRKIKFQENPMTNFFIIIRSSL